MSTISNEQTASAAAEPVTIDYAAHTLTISAPDFHYGCGDERCCGAPPRRSYCSCGAGGATSDDVDYLVEEHVEHVAQAHDVDEEAVDEDHLKVVDENGFAVWPYSA